MIVSPLPTRFARFCEARVWSFFSKVAPGIKEEYLDYVSGKNLSHRMPLFVKPSLVPGGKLSLNDTFWHFRNHYEGTYFDDTKDVGAGPFSNAYRYSPLTWKLDSDPNSTYVNERAISTQYTGWHFTAHVRPTLPPPVRGILWFGPDDTKHSLNVPFYGGSTQVPLSWTGKDCMGRTSCRHKENLPGTITDFSFDSAHWVWNLIANYAYANYERVEPDIRAELRCTEARYFDETAEVDKKATAAWQATPSDPSKAVEIITNYSYTTAYQAVTDRLAFWKQLFVKYVDGEVTVADKSNQVCECEKQSPGYRQSWLERIVKETGDHYRIPAGEELDAATDANINTATETISKLHLIGPSRRAKKQSNAST
eukprot:g2329.t1